MNSLGEVNGHIVGRLLKETVRRATVAIRNERLIFEAHGKVGNSGTMDDVFTSADIKAQDVYVRLFAECFPGCGVIAEEGSFSVTAVDTTTPYFTVDPLDGTKAYIRRQSHGVATMVALVIDGEVESAYVGDINTEEVYGYRPDSNHVHRITRLDTVEVIESEKPPNAFMGYALLRDPPDRYSSETRDLLGKFKDYEVMGSSIGTWMARLWKREVCGVFIPPGWETPWDSTPIQGISRKLGYVYLRPDGVGGWMPYSPQTAKQKYHRDHDVLVVHKNDLGVLFSIPK